MKELISKLVKLGSKIDFGSLVAVDLVLFVLLHAKEIKLIEKNRKDINTLSEAMCILHPDSVEIKKEVKDHE